MQLLQLSRSLILGLPPAALPYPIAPAISARFLLTSRMQPTLLLKVHQISSSCHSQACHARPQLLPTALPKRWWSSAISSIFRLLLLNDLQISCSLRPSALRGPLRSTQPTLRRTCCSSAAPPGASSAPLSRRRLHEHLTCRSLELHVFRLQQQQTARSASPSPYFPAFLGQLPLPLSEPVCVLGTPPILVALKMSLSHARPTPPSARLPRPESDRAILASGRPQPCRDEPASLPPKPLGTSCPRPRAACAAPAAAARTPWKSAL
mmetsp:Transcript_115582/g.200669  ORF Transcript_115582/g.200669 Transcript_115582/m.200669 type:complete len:265 (-) Transcript_115582:1136-1930(-)